MNEFEREPVVEPRATTPKGFPYPLPTDPVSQGAAAIQALALAVDGVVTDMRALSVALKANFTSSVFNYVLFDSAAIDDQGGMAAGIVGGNINYFVAPEPGDYVATVYALWQTATGTGAALITIEHYTAGVVKVANLGGQSIAALNGYLSCMGVARMAAGERLYVGASAQATGVAGFLTLRFAVMRL